MEKKKPSPPNWWPFRVTDPNILKTLRAADKDKKDKPSNYYPPALV